MKHIKDDDIYFIRLAEEDGNNPLKVAENLGYIINKDIILEIIMAGIDTGMIKNTTVKVFLPKSESDSKIVGELLRKKIFELYGTDTFQLISVAYRYPYQRGYVKRTEDEYVEKIIGVPVYIRNIICGIGLNKCKSLYEIKNFRLDNYDEKIRKGFGFSDRTEERRN